LLPGGHAILIVLADGTISCAQERDGYRAEVPPEELVGNNIRHLLYDPGQFFAAMRSVIATAKPVTIRVSLCDGGGLRVTHIMPCVGGLGERRQRVLVTVHRVEKNEEEKWGT